MRWKIACPTHCARLAATHHAQSNPFEQAAQPLGQQLFKALGGNQLLQQLDATAEHTLYLRRHDLEQMNQTYQTLLARKSTCLNVAMVGFGGGMIFFYWADRAVVVESLIVGSRGGRSKRRPATTSVNDCWVFSIQMKSRNLADPNSPVQV